MAIDDVKWLTGVIIYCPRCDKSVGPYKTREEAIKDWNNFMKLL